MPESTEVVIVGAGPTGLMAAALLARCGIRTRLLEKNAGPSGQSRAFGIQAKSMELLLNLGIVDKFLEHGIIATGAQVFVDGHQAAEINFDDIGRADTPYSFLFMVPQSEIEALLAEDVRAHGIAVEYSQEVEGFEMTESGVTVRIRNEKGESTIECAYLIGADGAHSIVRKTLGLSYDGAPYPQGFFLADCKVEWPLDYEHFKVFVHDQEFAVYLPLKGTDVCRIICAQPMDDPGTPAAAEGNTAAPLELSEVEEAFRKATCLDVKLQAAGWLSRYRIHHRGVDRYVKGRGFVAGDAAHIHSPAGGQGMNTGLQDVANLVWKLALLLRGHGTAALLESYHQERHPVGERVLKYTDRVFANVASHSHWRTTLRNHLLPLIAGTVSKIGYARSRFFHFISQLGIRYEDVPFLRDDLSEKASGDWKDGLAPGHRAPNALVSRDCDIFKLLTGYSFHVLAISAKALGREEIEHVSQELKNLPEIGLPLKTHFITHSLIGRDPRILQVESSQVLKAFGLSLEQPQALFLVRPDGYIAFRSDRWNFEGLREFLRTSFGQSA